IACFISITRSRSLFASGSFIPLIVRQISTEAFGDMRSWRPEHFTVRSGSKPVMEYPRSGIPFSPEASRSPSPQAKNPLGKHDGRNSFYRLSKAREILKVAVFIVVTAESCLDTGLSRPI